MLSQCFIRYPWCFFQKPYYLSLALRSTIHMMGVGERSVRRNQVYFFFIKILHMVEPASFFEKQHPLPNVLQYKLCYKLCTHIYEFVFAFFIIFQLLFCHCKNTHSIKMIIWFSSFILILWDTTLIFKNLPNLVYQNKPNSILVNYLFISWDLVY